MFQFKTQLRQCERGFPGNAVVKDPPANAGGTGDLGPSLGQEDPLEEAMAAHSSILDRIILWTEKPGRRQSRGSQRAHMHARQ